MDRLPFDPAKMAQARAVRARAGGEPPAAAPLTVSQLAERIAAVVREGLPAELRVVGEVSGFRERTHWYFDLKDPGAIVNCVMFAAAARRAGFTPANGQAVVATGRLEHYAPQGRLSLVVTRLEPVGAGALELAFRKLCDGLRALGWFDDSRKRPLPAFPRRVAIVTSRTGAALQDVLDTARRRCRAVELLLLDVRVQGDAAAGEIVRALRWLSRHHRRLGLDAILVTRGGGSMEDLWAFNDRAVAEAIVRCPVPVVAAIGHETDTTIAELVADVRCATPTQAAMRLCPDVAALTEQVDLVADRLAVSLARRVREERRRLHAAARHPFFTDPGARVRAARQQTEHAARHLGHALAAALREARHRAERLAGRLDAERPAALHARTIARVQHAEMRLSAAVRRRLAAADPGALALRLARAGPAQLARASARLRSLERHLNSVGPMCVLRRGFSITIGSDGALIRSVAQVHPGESVRTRVADGEFTSTVGEARSAPPSASGPMDRLAADADGHRRAQDGPAAVADHGQDGHAAPTAGSRRPVRKAEKAGGPPAAPGQMDLFGGGR